MFFKKPYNYLQEATLVRIILGDSLSKKSRFSMEISRDLLVKPYYIDKLAIPAVTLIALSKPNYS